MTTTRATADESPRITGTEWALLAVVVLGGFAARAWSFTTAGLNQYDEGVYALSALALADRHDALALFPGQSRFFAPPVYYTLVGLLNRISGTASAFSSIGLNVALGSLSVGLLWHVARTWFGPVAALVAATLLAFSEFHIAFSRSGLTDVAFAFFFLLALHLIVAALSRESVRLSVVAGLAVGVAWNTKYHGWFALFVGTAANVPRVWRDGWRTLLERRIWLPVAAIWVVAIACYLPWLAFIQSQPGGYAYFASYQRRFVDLHWVANLMSQVRMQSFFEGAMSRTSVVAVLLVGGLAARAALTWRRFLVCVAVLSLSSLVIGSAGTLFVAAVVATPILLRQGTPAGWTLLGWLALWMAAAPFYRPYARLMIPAMLAMQMAAGVAMARIFSSGPSSSTGASSRRGRDWRQFAAAAAAMAGVAAMSMRLDTRSLWRRADDTASVAQAISSIVPRGEQVIVLGEPALGFYLHASGHPGSATLENVKALAALRTPAYVATGVYVKRAPDLRRDLENLGGRLVPIATYPYVPNDVRLIDDMGVPEARAYVARSDATFDITLYRLNPEVKP